MQVSQPKEGGAKATTAAPVTHIAAKRQRAEHVNEVMRIIASHGRRFFYSATSNRYASIEVDARGRVWFIDDYSGKAIYTHPTGFTNRWRGFTHGGTLRSLVEAFRDYITNGVPLSPAYLGPERHRLTDGNIWGYDDNSMRAVRELAGAFPVFAQPVSGEVPHA